jgi:hypothetical protein
MLENLPSGAAEADFGDAPAPYATTLSEDGARHEVTGPILGTNRDTETDGTHSAAASADDTTCIDDEDGVTFSTIQVGQLASIVTVNVQNAPSGAKLDAWIDFNGDGSWGGSGEKIFASQDVVVGDNDLTFDVPSWAIAGETYARFRLSTVGDLDPTGFAIDGEVEDYLVNIAPELVSAVTPSVDLGEIGAGVLPGIITFEVHGDVQNVDFQVEATCLYKGQTATSLNIIPLSGAGAEVVAALGSPVGDISEPLPWTTAITSSIVTNAQGIGITEVSGGISNVINGMRGNSTVVQQYESGQNNAFSQEVVVTIEWDQINHCLPVGQYGGYVKLKARPESSDNWSEAEVQVFARVVPTMKVVPVDNSPIELDGVQTGQLLGEKDFQVYANTQFADLQVVTTCLYKSGDPTSGYVIPVAVDGAEVVAELGVPSGGDPELLLWTSKPLATVNGDGTVTVGDGIDYGNGMKAAESDVTEYESGQNNAFSQGVSVSAVWVQIASFLPAGEYTGRVKLRGRATGEYANPSPKTSVL